MANDLILESLEITFQHYGADEGKYTGSLAFKGHYGRISITLDPIISEKVLTLCAEALVENARQVADNLTASVINQSGKQLAPPPTGDDKAPF